MHSNLHSLALDVLFSCGRQPPPYSYAWFYNILKDVETRPAVDCTVERESLAKRDTEARCTSEVLSVFQRSVSRHFPVCRRIIG